jgi:hypothetical protein
MTAAAVAARGNGFRSNGDEAIGSDPGTHDLGFALPEPIASAVDLRKPRIGT